MRYLYPWVLTDPFLLNCILILSPDMTHGGELWVAYQFASRGSASPTTQLIELEFTGQKLFDLEDVLDYGMASLAYLLGDFANL